MFVSRKWVGKLPYGKTDYVPPWWRGDEENAKVALSIINGSPIFDWKFKRPEGH